MDTSGQRSTAWLLPPYKLAGCLSLKSPRDPGGDDSWGQSLCLRSGLLGASDALFRAFVRPTLQPRAVEVDDTPEPLVERMGSLQEASRPLKVHPSNGSQVSQLSGVSDGLSVLLDVELRLRRIESPCQ